MALSAHFVFIKPPTGENVNYVQGENKKFVFFPFNHEYLSSWSSAVWDRSRIATRMNSFKSFVKNIADKAPDFASPSKGGVSGASALPEDGAEGFICPICMKGFMNPDDLQIHFERDHGDGEDKSLKHDVKELQTTLKEEQFYSAELKREVERLSDAVHHKDLADQDEEKVMLQSQVEALQMGKDVCKYWFLSSFTSIF